MGLFGRQVSINFGLAGTDGREFTELRIRFRTEMKRSSDPNKGAIEIWNLTKESAALLQNPDVVIRLSAGYETPRQIFKGNPVLNGVTIKRTGPDRIARIDALDSGTELAEARVCKTFSTGTSFFEVINELLNSTGLPIGTVAVPDNVGSYPDGVTLLGNSRDLLDTLAESVGGEWFVNDGIINFVGSNEPLQPLLGPLFSVANGNLVGSPVPKGEGLIEITALLDPSIRPGTPFRVESEQYTGDYTARDVTFAGDSGFDNPFYVTIIGTRRST